MNLKQFIPKNFDVKTAIFAFICVVVITELIYLSQKNKRIKKENKLLEEENDYLLSEIEEEQRLQNPTTEGRTCLIFNLDKATNIAELDPITRKTFGDFHDSVFEKDNWADKLPAFSFPAAWKVKQLPASRNTLIRFDVTIPDSDEVVSVRFDPYGLYTNNKKDKHWIVRNEGSSEQTEIPMAHHQKLLKAIESNLNV